MATSRREFLIQAGAIGGAVAAAAALPRWARAGLAEPGGTILKWDEVRPGIRAAVSADSGGNSVVVAGEGAALVIDAKFPLLGVAIRRDAESFFDSPAEITLLNTHHHADHTGGNVGFAGVASRAAHPRAIERIAGQFDMYLKNVEAGPSQASRFDDGSGRIGAIARGLADRSGELKAGDWTPGKPVNGGDALTVGGVTAELHHFGPGHTDNDLVVRLPKPNVVHTGDLVFNALNPYFDPDGGATARGWAASLRKVLELCDDETVVVPGHGPVGDKKIVAWQIRYMDQLIAAVKKQIDDGVPKEEAVTTQFPFMMGLGFAQVTGRAIAAVYDELKGDG